MVSGSQAEIVLAVKLICLIVRLLVVLCGIFSGRASS
jgi:hypothetical protein